MRKPLLTDEMIADAKRKDSSSLESNFGYQRPYLEDWDTKEIDAKYEEMLADDFSEFEEEWDEEYHGYEEGQTIRIPVAQSIVKSRRIETVKRQAFQEKINKILFWIVVLVILFLLAVFYL